MTDERRKRYAAAIENSGAVAYPMDYYIDADAAMAVADAEMGCGCESHTSNEECEGPVLVVLAGLREENARLRAELALKDAEQREIEGDCIRLSEELDEAREANAELSKCARDATHWEHVADRMRSEITRLRAELERERYEEYANLLALYEMTAQRDENSRAENASLRAELGRLKTAARIVVENQWYQMLSEALATIERVRAVLDAGPMTGHEMSQAVRHALDATP